MKRILMALALASAAVSSPAAAQWRLVESGTPREVVGGALVVTPPDDWNRATERPTRRTEIWTKDGTTLGELDFWLGVRAGEPLFKEKSKKKAPLPKFDPKMLPTDLVEFFEDTARTVLGGSLFEVNYVRPATLAGHPGVEFEHTFTGADEVARKGLVRGAIIGDRLYLINWDAPKLHYFDAHLGEVRAIMDSAKLGKAGR
ncbi:hypothetical protein ACWPM1_04685 [Tsuneonella sp. HG249]